MTTPDTPAPGTPPQVRGFLDAFGQARNDRDQRAGTWREITRLILPHHAPMWGMTEQACLESMIDTTAADAVPEFTSLLINGLVPYFQKWLALRAGWQVPAPVRKDLNRQLQEPSDQLFSIFQSAGLYDPLDIALEHAGVGTAFFLIERDELNELRFRAEPWAYMAALEGPTGEVDTVFREETTANWKLLAKYPHAEWPAKLLKEMRETPFGKQKITCGVQRDRANPRDETWHYMCVHSAGHLLDEQTLEGEGSCPWVVMRWHRVTDQAWGLGPIWRCLPAARRMQFVEERLLNAIELASSGIYLVDNDGFLNPETVRLVPGAMIGRAPGGKGMEPLGTSLSIDWTKLDHKERRSLLRQQLYLDRMGSLEQPIRSATEIMQRQMDLARAMGTPYVRLVNFLEGIVKRSVYVLTRSGTLRLPAVNGKVLSLQTLGPFSRGQQMEAVTNLQSFVQIITQSFGPEAASMAVKVPGFAELVADLMQVPAEIVMTDADRAQVMQAGMQVGQQTGQLPAPPGQQQPQLPVPGMQ